MNKPIEKAYIIDETKVLHGHEYYFEFVYAKSRGKAKSKIFSNFEGGKLYVNDEDIGFLNMPVIRHHKEDLYLFEGKKLTKYNIEHLLAERKRLGWLDRVMKDETIEYCYIRKGGYYRPNCNGYTQLKSRAGVYKKQEAVVIARQCNELWLNKIDINEHNKMISDEINELKTRIIK